MKERLELFRPFFVVISIFAIFVLTFLALWAFSPKDKNRQAMDISGENIMGEKVSLADNKGKLPTVLVFVDPQDEVSNELAIRLKEKIGDDYKKSIDIIAISINEKSKKEQIKLFDENKSKIANTIIDDGTYKKLYNISTAPVTYFINEDLTVVSSFLGTIKDKTIDDQIKRIK